MKLATALTTLVAVLVLAMPGAADVATSPPAIPQFTGFISGSNVIFHWVSAPGAAQYQLLQDGVLVRTVTSGTHSWLLPVKTARGHGFQVRAVGAAGRFGPATYERLSPLPALRGLTLKAATAALRAGHFAPGTTLYYHAYGAKGIVIDVRSVGVMPIGGTVGLLISK